MDSEETLKYLQQKYPEDLNENYRCYWWCTSNIDGSALTYYLVLHDKFCETDKELMALLSHRKGEYFTDVEMYRYMNSLIIRLCKEEIYGNDDNAVVSNTKL